MLCDWCTFWQHLCFFVTYGLFRAKEVHLCIFLRCKCIVTYHFWWHAVRLTFSLTTFILVSRMVISSLFRARKVNVVKLRLMYSWATFTLVCHKWLFQGLTSSFVQSYIVACHFWRHAVRLIYSLTTTNASLSHMDFSGPKRFIWFHLSGFSNGQSDEYNSQWTTHF